MAKYDLALLGGRLIDPGQNIDRVEDIAFKDGEVAAIGADARDATETHSCEGHIVCPGLIDLHTHVYWGGTSLGVDPVAYASQSAVTTAVDTGSAGPGNFAGFRAHVIDPCPVRILAYLHVGHAGIFGFSKRVMVGESENIRLMDPVTAAEVVAANRDVIVGIKVRLGRHASGDQGMSPFTYALQAAEQAGVPLMAHIDEPPPSYTEIVEALRPGDVLTHCFRPFPNTPLAPDGTVRPEVLAARDRGVIFDIGHGMGSFAFDTARKMLAQNFPPDVISSDVHALCIDGPAFDQVTTMTKFLHLGMDLGEVIKRSTVTPAAALGRPELGSLTIGTPGDASILQVEHGDTPLIDARGNEEIASERIIAKSAIVAGEWLHSFQSCR